MKLSVNLNKVALLRNARGEGRPSVRDFANRAIDYGVSGLTLHPRPDHRHATSKDVVTISQLCKERNVEFNIEGNPFSSPSGDFKGFLNLVEESQPDQITLVPDSPDQITSDHGWAAGNHDEDLKNIINNLKDLSNHSQISLFVDNMKGNKVNYDAIDYAIDVGANLIEIHTGYFSKHIEEGNLSVVNKIESLINKANQSNLMVNAGHDLNLINLPHLVKIGGINEVSIGHAIVIDALNYGFEATIKSYIDTIKG